MIKDILAVGDSFTWGEELDDRGNAWPVIVGTMLKANVLNQAKPGSGNQRIIRTVMQHVSSGQPCDLVLVGWTSPGRMEFSDASGVFDIWPGYSGTMFTAGGQEWRLDLLEYINKHHDPAWIYEKYVMDVMLLQSWLSHRNMRYLMINTGCNEYYHKSFFSKTALSLGVDSSTYLGWPSHGMSEWTVDCERGPRGHFLERGHRMVAAQVCRKIIDLGWKA